MGFLERNNPHGARDVYVRGLLDGTWRADDSRRIIELQDDPTELVGLIKEANKLPEIGEALSRMLVASDPPPRQRPWLAELGYGPKGREDAVAVRGPNGKGYNPYRAGNGQFGSGPHKQRPKGPGRAPAAPEAAAKPRVKRVAGPAAKPRTGDGAGTAAKPKRTKFDDSKHRETIAGHKATEAHHRTQSLAIVAQQRALREQAKALPAKDKAGRAALRAQHSALGKQRDEHREAAREARMARISESKAMQSAKAAHIVAQRTGQPVAKPATPKPAMPKPADNPTKNPTPTSIHALVANDPRRAEIVNGIVDARPGHDPAVEHSKQWSWHAQAAIREHHNEVLSKYGLHDHDTHLFGGGTVEVRTFDGMGGSNGLHWDHSGKVALDVDVASKLHEHSSLDSAGLKRLGRGHLKADPKALEVVDAYRISTHEAIHGFGPSVLRVGPAHTMVEEVTTEMSARKVTADVHGFHVSEYVPVGGRGSYDNYIVGIVESGARTSGKGQRAAHAALAETALAFKRRKDENLKPDDAVRDLARDYLTRLGVKDKTTHDAFERLMHRIALEGGSP